MALDSRLVVSAVSKYTSALDLATGVVPLEFTKSIALASGVGSGQADKIWHDERTIAASGTDDLDLAGVLADAFGSTLTLARVKGLIVAAAAANVNNVVVGNAASNAWATLLGATHTLQVRPGGLIAAFAPDATGYAVTGGTGDILRIANGGAGTGVIYDIVIIGASS